MWKKTGFEVANFQSAIMPSADGAVEAIGALGAVHKGVEALNALKQVKAWK